MRQPNSEREVPVTMNSAINHHQLLSSFQDLHDHGQSSMLPHSNFDPTSSQNDFVQQMISVDAFPWADDHTPPDVVENLGEHQLLALDSNMSDGKALMLQQQLLLSTGLVGSMSRADRNDVDNAPAFPDSVNLNNDASIKSLFNGFTGTLSQTSNILQHFHHPQNYGAAGEMTMSQPAASGSIGGGATGQPKQRARARRGQATDPHSIAERLRRERIAERMKSLQELVPNANKTDKASMLDEIIEYVQYLQLQVKVLSMSRLGGAAAVAPLLADKSPQGKNGVSSSNNDGMTVAERQVAKLLEEDMGSAMQYLQGKGLCLMPIPLAAAISTAASHSRNLITTNSNIDAGSPTSPSISVLTVQSTTMGGDVFLKDVPKLECDKLSR